MCSDGQVQKVNAQQGHKLWKEWVSTEYSKYHNVVPYVETVGISCAHDADILDGFICDENAGNYVFCKDVESIQEAFNNAAQETMLRKSNKIEINFPFDTLDAVLSNNGNENELYFNKTHLIVNDDDFIKDYWISLKSLPNNLNVLSKASITLELLSNKADGIGVKKKMMMKKDDDSIMIVNVPIHWYEIDGNSDECHSFAIEFYHQMLRDMLNILKNITDGRKLKEKCIMIENTLKNKEKLFENVISAEPEDKIKLQQKIKQYLELKSSETQSETKTESKTDTTTTASASSTSSLERAKLMREYKRLNNKWKEYRRRVLPFQTTLKSLKELIKEIMIGKVRIEEIRQHILNLHYTKKHTKRINKLILTDEQLEYRQELYQQTLKYYKPRPIDCEYFSNEFGSGCYLSTFTFKELALDGDPLWLCGYVNRTGGALVSNPELIQIKYISPDLVSDSYFKLAIETCPQGFADSSRQMINSRLFPIYGNKAHFRSTSPYLNEALSHTLSGRIDIRVVDYGCLSKVIGYIASNTCYYSEFWLNRLFKQLLPSLRLFCKSRKVAPYMNKITRNLEFGSSRNKVSKITLLEQSKCRLKNYIVSFEARTSALVSCSEVLFCDKMLHFDDIELNREFWLSQLFQRLRQCMKTQLPTNKTSEEDLLRQRLNIHSKCLQVIVRGLELDADRNHDGKADGDEKDATTVQLEEKDVKLKLDPKSKVTRWSKTFNVPKAMRSKNYHCNLEVLFSFVSFVAFCFEFDFVLFCFID